MTYVYPDYKTKKALREAVEAGESVYVFEPGWGKAPLNGPVYLEGPHERHRWYATGQMENGTLIKVR